MENILIEIQSSDSNSYLKLRADSTYQKDEEACYFTLDLKSGKFECHDYTFSLDNKIDELVRDLKSMYEKLAGEIELRYRNEQDFIRLEMNKLGNLFVSGELVEYEGWEEKQTMKFQFQSDQTSILGIINSLQRYIVEIY